MNKLLCRTIQACMHPENGIVIKKKGVFEAKERLASFQRCCCILFNTNLYVCSGASPLWVRSLWRCSAALDAYSLSAPTKNEGMLLLDRIFAVWCLMCFKAYFISRYVCKPSNQLSQWLKYSYAHELYISLNRMLLDVPGHSWLAKRAKNTMYRFEKNQMNLILSAIREKSPVFSLEPNVNQ